MNNIETYWDYGGGWFQHGKIVAKGYAFMEGQLLTENELIEKISRCSSPEELSNLANSLNGLFCIAGELAFGTFALVDRIRSIPLFYKLDGNQPRVSDNPYQLANSNGICNTALVEFKTSGYSLGNKTLFKDVLQVEAGSFVYFTENQPNVVQYFLYCTPSTSGISFQEAKQILRRILDEIMKRMVASISDNHIAIPLSGGYDSRFIAAWLSINGFKSFSTFTYGREGNQEMLLAEKVAKTLRCKWIPIPYTSKLIYKFPEVQNFDSFIRFASTACSMPFFQDYHAMKELFSKNQIPPNSVIVPGHSGDFIAGSHLLPNHERIRVNRIIRYLIDLHHTYCTISGNERKELLNEIANFFQDHRTFIPYSVLEWWDFKERQAKFIVNSCRVYQFFGYNLRLPLFDNELVEFFKYLPFNQKLYKKLYDETLEEYYFKPLNLQFEWELQPSPFTIFAKQAKISVKAVFPFVKRFARKPQDTICYTEIADELFTYFGYTKRKEFNVKKLNAPIVDWYLRYFQKELQSQKNIFLK